MKPYYEHNGITIYHGDCLEVMPQLGVDTIDATIADVPFGSTDNPWDIVIPFEPMWTTLYCANKRRAPIALFARSAFSASMLTSNTNNYKYKWVWNKGLSGSFHLAKFQPLQVDEDILVFGRDTVNYYPQMKQGAMRYKGGHNGHVSMGGLRPTDKYLSDMYYPSNILTFTPVREGNVHPTQKPIGLLEYLVKTYTNGGDTVLDFTMGSGTTLRAAKNLGRRAIGIEIEERYCEIAARRLSQEVMELAI